MNKKVCCFLLSVVIPMFLVSCGDGSSSNGGGSHSSNLATISMNVAEEVKGAVEKGVAWLLAQQNLDGSWGNTEKVAVTALAVKKLEHHAVDRMYGLGLDSPFDAPYGDRLQAGLDFLFSNAFVTPIWVQPAGDPDTDDDGIGVHFGIPEIRRTYNTGIVLMAIAESRTPDRVVEVTGSPVHGWTYLEVVQDTVDYLCFGQNDSDWPRGGWGYYENFSTHSDNSNTGYAVHGLLYAEAAPPEGFGLIVPEFVKEELEIWIAHIQCRDPGPNFGGSGYVNPCLWVNILKTGNLLKELALVGSDKTDQRAQDALDYLHLHWNDQNNEPGWRGFPAGVASYQAMFTTMKGLTSLGIYEFGDPLIDWRADFVAVLLDQQKPDGSWPVTLWDWDPPILSVLWALLTLQKVAPLPIIEVPVDIKPQSCPNPLNVKSGGVLPVAILGTDMFDVTQVAPASIKLQGVSPLRWSFEDVATPFEPLIGKENCVDDCTTEGADEYLDLRLKFDTQDVVSAIDSVTDGDCLVLTLTGDLKEEYGSTAIVGEDIVVILKKGK